MKQNKHSHQAPPPALGPCVRLAALALLPAAAAAQTTILRIEAPGSSSSDGAFATAVSHVEDVDGDGSDELLIGSPSETGVHLTAGAVRVVSGDTGVVLHLIRGQAPFEQLGRFVAGLGDVDGDGAGDFMASYVSGGGVGPRSLRAFSGKTAAVLYELELDDSGVWYYAVDLVGDVNGDGVEDLGATKLIPPVPQLVEWGGARVYSGTDGTILFEVSGPEASGGGIGGYASICGVGDLDGDGRGEFAISSSSPFATGLVRIFSGADGGQLFAFSSHASDQGIQAECSAGDWNDDGRSDFILSRGTTPYGIDERTLEVRSGADGSVLQTIQSPVGTRFDACVNVGDVDGDERQDLATALRSQSPLPGSTAVVVLRGGTGQLMVSPIRTNLLGSISQPVAPAGDLNGDGLADIVYGERVSFVNSAVAFAPVSLPIGWQGCFGGEPLTPCPCGNDAWPQAETGCINSTGVGAALRGYGIHLYLNDNLELELTGAAPASPVLVLRAVGGPPRPPFASDGAPCFGYTATEVIASGITDAAGGLHTAVSLDWYYTEQAQLQAWYRDTAPSAPCGTGNNFSNALVVSAD